MPSQVYDIQNLHNESDVEQKLIMPLLTKPSPFGLGFGLSSIRTKPNTRRLTIGKGSDKKLYYPDYIVVLFGIPIVVVEAKSPDEEVEEGYREARLYAAELNAQFPAGVNPVSTVICSNGKCVLAGRWDNSEPVHKVDCTMFEPSNESFANLLDFAGSTSVTGKSRSILESMTTRPFHRPTRFLGGQSVRNEEIGHNAFGATLSLDYRHLFNPTSDEERAYIVKNAYISSKRRDRYIAPIDKIIRAATPPSESAATLVEDTGSPNELIHALRRDKLEHQVLLLVGGVGSGKSTFVDYLKEVALPKDIMDTTTWVRVNMNNAPLPRDLLYNWVCAQITDGLKSVHRDIDFDSLDVIQKVYGVELSRLKKGALQLLEPDSSEYKTRLADEIIRLQDSPQQTTNAHARFLCAERGKLLVVVLDNCDKRLRDEQLLMFQAAQWLQQEFRCLIILPLRDETYDNHRNEPPLDTAIKDLTFRIEPPLFQKVLSRRIDLALKEIKGDRKHSYNLPNGMRVEYPASEQAYYLSTILRSVFEYDAFIRRLIVGLAGRDIRRAMEIFLEFCTSGHIGEDQILRIMQSEGKYTLPYDIVSRVLLRLNRRFYHGDHSFVKNIFSCNLDDPRPNYFSRLAILMWLSHRFSHKGPTGLPGYHSVETLTADLVILGMDSEAIHRELLYLLKASCIIAEHLRTDLLNRDDLVKLAPAGFVHLDLLGDPGYIAAISEDTWYNDENYAREVAQRIGERRLHYSEFTTYLNARLLHSYLNTQFVGMFPNPDAYLTNVDWQYMTDLAAIEEGIAHAEGRDPWLTLDRRFHVGQVVKGTVRKINEHGAFVELEPKVTGRVGREQMYSDTAANAAILPFITDVRIDDIDQFRRRIRLSLIECC